MTDLLDIAGLAELADELEAAGRPIEQVRFGAVPTLDSIGRGSDAASIRRLLDRVAATLSMASIDADTRATEMAATEAEIQRLWASFGFGSRRGSVAAQSGITDEQRAAWRQLHHLLDRRDVYEQIGGYPAAVLVAEMDARIASLVADFTKGDWTAVAYLDAGLDPTTWDPSEGLAANDATVQKIYAFYGDMFLENPEVQWAGLANLVGAAFYAGWQDLYTLRQIADDSDRAEYLWEVLPLPAVPDQVWDAVDLVDAVPLSPTDLAAMLATNELEWLEVRMLTMQREIFDDLGWQLSAYRYGGLSGIEAITPAIPRGESLAQVWADIASGDPVRVTEGNEALLRREQFQIIQDDYDEIRSHHGPVGEVMTRVITMISSHGIPGGHPYREVVTHDVGIPVVLPDAPALWPPWEVIPIQVEEVQFSVPRGNIANFGDRWEWIEADLLPAYEALLDDPVALRQLVDTPVAVRASEQRLLPFLPYPQ